MIYLAVIAFGVSFACACQKRRKILWFILSALPLIAAAAFRYGIGTDYFNYEYAFYRTWSTGNLEILYRALQSTVRYLTGDYRWMVAATSVLFVAAACLAMKQHSVHYGWSLYLFLEGTDFFEFMCHDRIMLGTAAVMVSLTFIKNRSFFKFLLCILIAAGFHSTCIAALLLYFLYDKTFRWYTFPIVAAVIAVVIRFAPVVINHFSLFARLLPYLNGERSDFLGGLLLLNCCVLAFLLLVKILSRDHSEISTFYVNVQAVACIIALVSSQIALAGRISTIFSIVRIFSLPYALNRFKRGKSRVMVGSIMAGLFAAYWFYAIVMNHGFGVFPYQSLWQQG